MEDAVTLLLVEDEPLLQNIMVAGLEDAGFRVVTAADGATASKSFHANADEIAALITDVRLGAGLDCKSAPKRTPASYWRNYLRRMKTITLLGSQSAPIGTPAPYLSGFNFSGLAKSDWVPLPSRSTTRASGRPFRSGMAVPILP